MVKILLIIAAVILLGLIALVIWATTLPKTVSASRTAVLPASPQIVFAVVEAVEKQPTWRTGVASVEVRDAGASWTEVTDRGMRIEFQRVDSRPPEVLSVRFSSVSGFSGEWRGEFAAEQAGTRVTFTETVTTPSPIGRVMARVFAPPGAHIEQYISDLRRAIETGQNRPD